MLAVLVASSLYVLLRDSLAQRNQDSRSNYISYVLSDGLRQTSDDLTRMARLYAVTGDPVYREHFDEILAIRNGESPRPQVYYQIPYWDIVLATGEHPGGRGEAAPISELIAAAGASPYEQSLLADTEYWSNVLAELENEVMDVVVARAGAGDGAYRLEGEALAAMQRLHGAEYHSAKERIMLPLVYLAGVATEEETTLEVVADAQQQTDTVMALNGLAIVAGVVTLLLARQRGATLRDRASLASLLSILAVAVFALLVQRFSDGIDSLAGELGERYRSYTLSDGLRQTSDDLTRMVRLYAATGDAAYRDHFDEILAIRNGEAPRPERYFEVPYWDIVLATGRHPGAFGDAVPIRALIGARDFTDDELALLAQAEDASNELVVLENEVMEVVTAEVAAGDGEYSLDGPAGDALQRLHGAEYHEAKAKIMQPLVGLARSVQERLATANNEARENAQQGSVLFGGAIVLAIVFNLGAVLLWRREPH